MRKKVFLLQNPVVQLDNLAQVVGFSIAGHICVAGTSTKVWPGLCLTAQLCCLQNRTLSEVLDCFYA